MMNLFRMKITNLMQQLQDILSRVRPTATRPTFRVELCESDTIQLLTRCLQVEVSNRGRELRVDESTIRNIESVSRWLTSDRKKSSLILYGQVGTGKTIMVEAIRTLIRTLYPCGDMSAGRYLKVITAIELSKLFENEKERKESYVSYKTAPWLAIDDLGAEPLTIKSYGNELTPMIDLIYHRYERQLMTIVTTNDNNEVLATKYGPRIADRFAEMFNRIPYVGDSYRKN